MVLKHTGMPFQLFIVTVFLLFVVTGCTELAWPNDNGGKDTGGAERSPPVSEKVDENIIGEIIKKALIDKRAR